MSIVGETEICATFSTKGLQSNGDTTLSTNTQISRGFLSLVDIYGSPVLKVSKGIFQKNKRQESMRKVISTRILFHEDDM